MATRPLNTPYTPGELTFGRYVATGLWLLSAALTGLLVVWSLDPMGV